MPWLLRLKYQEYYVNLNHGEQKEPPDMKESDLQRWVMMYVRKVHPTIGPLCFHVPLELLRRDNNSAAIFASLGACAGVSDIILLVPRGDYHGLVLELKAPHRRPTGPQLEFLEAARAQRYAAAWTDSYHTALSFLNRYLKLPPRAVLAYLQPEKEPT